MAGYRRNYLPRPALRKQDRLENYKEELNSICTQL